MKKFIYQILCFSIICILIIISCKKEGLRYTSSNNLHIKSDPELIAIFSTLGKLHNDGLESIFVQLSTKKSSFQNLPNNAEKKNILYGLIQTSINDFLKNNLDASTIDINATLNKVFTATPNFALNNKTIESQVLNTSKSITLSPTYFTLLHKIDSLIDNNSSEADFHSLIASNISILDEDLEKMQFIASASIAINSNLYWKKNLNKWQLLLDPNNVSKIVATANANTSTNSTAKEIGKSDVSGIIYGAGSGCLAGAVGTTLVVPVVGTVAGCAGLGALGAITGGLGNSAKTAIDSLVNWLTK